MSPYFNVSLYQHVCLGRYTAKTIASRISNSEMQNYPNSNPPSITVDLNRLALLLTLLNLSPVLELLGLMLSSVNAEHLGTLLSVIGTTENSIHVLKGDTLGFRDKEKHENAEQDIDGKEEEEALEASLGEECWEELLENGVGHILALRGHTDGLGSDVGGEDLTGPHPDTGTP